MNQEVYNVSDELDFSDAGVPTLKGATVTIVGAEREEKDNGTQLALTFEVDGLSFPITKGYWIRHSNPKAQNAGRGQLKRISTSALGTPTLPSESALVGAELRADVGEDANGFAEIKNFQPSVSS